MCAEVENDTARVFLRNKAFLSLLWNNLRGGEMLFEIKKPRHKPKLLYFKQHFDTKEVILQQVFVLYVQNEYLLHDLHLMMLFNKLPICVLYQYLLPDLHLMMLFNELPIYVLYQY